MHSPESVRIDKWLWAVRLYKTRSMATQACSAGKVRIDGHFVKAGRNVHIGECITAVAGEITRTVKVRALLEKRVGAKLVADFCEDLTPASEYEKARERSLASSGVRPRGAGRPTKKERRSLSNFLK